MAVVDTLTAIGLGLALIHFGVPLAYYRLCKTKWLPKPWNIKQDPNYMPKITIIIPTYNEAQTIKQKLDNISKQDYPKELLEITIIDSNSTDGTPQKIKEWINQHPDYNIKFITEPTRKGKAHALNLGLKHATGDIIIITDADSYWLHQNTLRTVTSYFADPQIGAVSCTKIPAGQKVPKVEANYRRFYNTIRVAESKAYATPIFHGELAAFRKELLEKIGGFPLDIGADDSHTATKIALLGYRAIIPENITASELVPKKGYGTWRIRRAQHLIQHFARVLKLKPKTPKEFKTILKVETFLHLLNPWLLLLSAILFITSAITIQSVTALTILTMGLLLLFIKQYRTWITTQAMLIIAAIRNLWTKELVWKKSLK